MHIETGSLLIAPERDEIIAADILAASVVKMDERNALGMLRLVRASVLVPKPHILSRHPRCPLDDLNRYYEPYYFLILLSTVFFFLNLPLIPLAGSLTLLHLLILKMLQLWT